MAELLLVLAGAGLTLAAVYLAGRAIAPALDASLSFGIGAAAVSYGVFALMLLHQARLPVLVSWLVVWIVAGLARGVSLSAPKPPVWFVAISAPFLVWYVAHALAPEIRSDANVYHLQPALDALRHGGFANEIDFYQRLPHATEMLFVPAWLIGGASSAKLIHFSFLLGTLPLIVRLARQLGLAGHVGYGAAGLYFCAPVVGVAGTAALNDAALVYFTVASVALALEGKPVSAGLLAGFCYGIKMTGGLAVPVVAAVFLARRRWRDAFVCGLAAAVVCSPWLIRNWIEIGNPLAPLGNRWFPNPYFYVHTEQDLAESLRSYGVSFWRRFPEVLVGSRLQGLIGPSFAFAPLVIPGWRQRAGRWLILLAVVFLTPWWLNAGARFLMPSLPFLALAMCWALPRRGVIALLAAHAVTVWPPVVFAYSPATLTFESFPWKAALRLESGSDYLGRVSEDFLYARMVERNTAEDAVILDLAGVHAAHARRRFLGSWRSAFAVRSLAALEFARASQGRPLGALEARFHPRAICGARLVRTVDGGNPWRIHNVEIGDAGIAVDPGGFMATSSTNVWDAPLAFDRDVATFWSPWRTPMQGMYLQVVFPESVKASRVRVLHPGEGPDPPMAIEICRDGVWNKVPVEVNEGPLLNGKAAAMAALKREGITHIVASVGYDGMGVLAESLANEAHEWNLEVVTSLYTVYLLKLL